MRKIFTLMLSGAMLCACTKHYLPEQIDIIELGATQKILTLPDTDPGSDQFTIYANCSWDYEQISGQEWLAVDSVSDNAMQFSFYANNGFKRSARIVVYKDNRRDTLCVRQRGVLTESVSLRSFSEVIPSDGGSGQTVVETTALEREIVVEAENPQHFSSLYYSGHKLYFTLLPATERDKKNYKVSVCFIDGWGEKIEAEISIAQLPKVD